ncbi:hypothetical protein ABEB36_011740 [Hypothenemus hampei]|uniref:C-type lectin domain-containing protein n=1 Tax=Hypothenemus hampei TaxID=57062 RepID=A0ABD1E936_HYPHA
MTTINLEVFLIILLVALINATNICSTATRSVKFFKLKSCHKSIAPPMARKRVTSLSECVAFTKEKNGLAFNFSPLDATNHLKQFIPNCHVLECPEIGNLSTLEVDLAFDYYSAFGDLNLTQNAVCIKSLGLFKFTEHYLNYTQSILACQNTSGDLADVTSEYRTTAMANLIKVMLPDWYKAAYVGLDDLVREGTFETSSGKPLTCTLNNFRAWAPGHPRSKHATEDCVTLDSDRLWRTTKCDKVRLKGLCELIPQPPKTSWNEEPKNVTCKNISEKNKGKMRKCLRQQKLFEIYTGSSRLDKCAMLNFTIKQFNGTITNDKVE